jgi:hypothetical protein
MRRFLRLFPIYCLSVFLVALLLPSYLPQANALPLQKQKKGKKTAKNAAPASAPAPASASAADTKAAAPASEIEKPSKAMWALDVAPYAMLGSGRPGKTPLDFDKPDGVAFTKKGWLLATDAKNHRVQIWDVKTRTRLGEFAHGIVGGEVVDIAVTPNDTVLVTDQILNIAYAFERPAPGATTEKGKPLGPYDLQFKGTRFGEQGFEKLGGIAVDARGRIYLVDAHLNEVRRFLPDFKSDPSWKFERARPDGTTYLNGCEGIAFDEGNGNLFVASEKDSIVQVFDLETGAYKKRLVGKSLGADNAPSGSPVFGGSIEGLTIAHNHLLAVDESTGQIQIFDLTRPDVFNADLAAYSSRPRRNSAYRGFFGHSPLVNFEDKTNVDLQRQVKDGAIIPGQANPPGYFCSPDAIASYTDAASGETYIAIADQCNYRIAVYRWSDISRAMNAVGPSRPEAAAGTVPEGENGAKDSGKSSAKGGGGKKKKGKKQVSGLG